MLFKKQLVGCHEIKPSIPELSLVEAVQVIHHRVLFSFNQSS